MNGIQSLFDKICLLNQEYKRLEDEKGESYNLFKVIDMASNETSVHSAFLADLLSPKGLHLLTHKIVIIQNTIVVLSMLNVIFMHWL